jgi:hypothetical protein
MFASTGHVVVSADNVSYGKSYGSTNAFNAADEVFSQYASIVATTQLINIRPTLFNNQSFLNESSSIDIINTGYSLGGMFGPMISQFIANNDILNPYNNTNANTIPLKLIQTISGAPTNQHELSKTVISNNYTKPTIWSFAIFASLTGNSPVTGLTSIARPSAVANCAPIWNPMYQNTLKNYISQVTNLIGSVVYNTGFNYIYQSDPSGAEAIYPAEVPYLAVPDASNFFTSGYITPNQLFFNPYYSDSSNYNYVIDLTKQSVFYTNPFVDYSDLSGTPITVIYSTGDELCCNNAGASTTYSETSANIYVGTPARDMTYQAYKDWVDSSSVSNGIWDQGKTFLDLSGGIALGGYTQNNLYNPIASTLLAVENNNVAVCIRVNKDNFTSGQNLLLQHNVFQDTVYQNGVRTYLNNRT